MLDSIQASDVQLAEGGIRAVCGPVAFAVQCSTRDGEALAGAARPVEVVCQVEVQDEQMALVGFCDTQRRDLYRALRQLPGIGRRSALAVLDCGETLDVLRAVAGADQAFFREVPGLGAKRIGVLIEQLERRYHEALPRALDVPVRWTVQARDALIVAGADEHRADRAVIDAAAQAPGSAAALLELARGLAA